jgi:hypothetical protein
VESRRFLRPNLKSKLCSRGTLEALFLEYIYHRLEENCELKRNLSPRDTGLRLKVSILGCASQLVLQIKWNVCLSKTILFFVYRGGLVSTMAALDKCWLSYNKLKMSSTRSSIQVYVYCYRISFSDYWQDRCQRKVMECDMRHEKCRLKIQPY